jgi:hypothetical protein
MSKIKNSVTADGVRMRKEEELVGLQAGTITLEISLAVLRKLDIALVIFAKDLSSNHSTNMAVPNHP